MVDQSAFSALGIDPSTLAMIMRMRMGFGPMNSGGNPFGGNGAFSPAPQFPTPRNAATGAGPYVPLLKGPQQPGAAPDFGMGQLSGMLSDPAKLQKLIDMWRGNSLSGPWNQGSYNVLPKAGVVMYDPATGGTPGIASALGDFNY